jgi:transaldolase/glucose-6-phosphate isomerase
VGFGPRFLHPTWQIDKGGPAFRLFRQAARDDASDLAVPGQVHTFGIVKAAQARGDCEVLAARGRCALRVHRSGDVQAGREALAIAVQEPRGPGA